MSAIIAATAGNGADSVPMDAERDFQRWWDEHSELDRLVAELESALVRGAIGPATTALEALASTLEGHFAVEEEVYFPLLESIDPAHQAALDAARLGHDKIRERIEQLRQLVDGGEVPAARRVLRTVLDRFRLHEEEEVKLVGRLERLTPPSSGD